MSDLDALMVVLYYTDLTEQPDTKALYNWPIVGTGI